MDGAFVAPGRSRLPVLVLALPLPPAAHPVVGPGPPPASEAVLLEPSPPPPAPFSSRPLPHHRPPCLTGCAGAGRAPPPLDGPTEDEARR